MWNKFVNLYNSNKKTFILVSIAIVVVLTLVIGSTFAFFMSVSNGGDETNVNVTTHTVDSLSLSVGDPITIEANQNNFANNAGNRPGSTTATATLIPNNKTNTATATYNLFFVIEENDLEYTTEDNTPELVLRVKNPDGETYLQNITGLLGDNGTFDITTRQGSFLIASDYPITANGSEETQTWEVEVILINLDTDQDANAGKHLSGKLVITQDQISTYEPARVNSITTTGADLGVTYHSISLALNTSTGTELIDKYYYAIEEDDEVIAFIPNTNILLKKLSINDVTFEESNSAKHLFDNLTEDTEYTIYSYVVDRKGIKSNTYSTNIKTIEYDYPEVTDITTESTLYTIKVTVNAVDGENSISEYSFSKDNGATWTPYQENNSYTFTGLDYSSGYDIKVKVKDSIGFVSADYYERVETEAYRKSTVNSISTSKTYDTVTATIAATNGSYNVSKYYYCIKEECTDNDWFEGSPSYTFTGLAPDTTYTVKAKVKDSNNVYSDVTTVNVTTDEYNVAVIRNVETSSEYNSVTITIDAVGGDGDVEKYYYNIQNGVGEYVESTSPTYTFENLTTNTTFYIKVYVKDDNDVASVIYSTTAATVYVEPTIVSVLEQSVTSDSAILKVNASAGSTLINGYYYRLNSNDAWTYSASNTLNITGLNSNTNYNVEIKAIDIEEHYTEVFTKAIKTEYVEPTVSNFTVTAISWNSISVSVTGTKGSTNLDKYYYKTNVTDWTPFNSNTFTFEDLEENTPYTLKVKVVDTASHTSNILTIDASTRAYVAPMVTATVTPNSYSITINAIGTDGDGSVTNYKYSIDGGEHFITTESASYTFDSLNSNTDYDVVVVAVDERGSLSDEYTETVKTLYVNPSINTVTDNKTYNSITLTIDGVNGSGTIDKYYFRASGEEYGNAQSSNSHTFTGLSENTDYTFYVKVEDNNSHSSSEEEVIVRTNAYGLPEIKSTTHSETYNSITVNVSAEGHDGTISKYSYILDNGTPVEKTSSSGTNTHTFTVSEGNTPHTVRVMVTDSNGRESDTTISDIVTPSYVPATINSVTKTATSTSSVTLSIDATKGQNDIAGYKFSTDGTSFGSLVPSSSESFSYEVTGLSDNTDYNIYVIAVDSIGRTSSASVVSAKTSYIEPTVTLTVSNVTQNSVRLTATATKGSTNITGYKYQVGSSGWTNVLASNIYDGFDSLEANTPYVFSVEVTDSAGHTATATASATTYAAINDNRCNTSTKTVTYITYCTETTCYDASGNTYSASNISTYTIGSYSRYDCSGGYVRNRRYNSCTEQYEYETTGTSCTNYNTNRCNISTKSSQYITYCTSSYCYDSSGNSYSASNITTLNEGTYSRYDCNNGYIRNRRYNSCKETYEYETTATSCTNYNTNMCNTSTKNSQYITYCTSSLCYDSSGNSYTASNITTLNEGTYETYDCNNGYIRNRRYNSCKETYEYQATGTSCTAYNSTRCYTPTGEEVSIKYCTSSVCLTSGGLQYPTSDITDVSYTTYSAYDCNNGYVRNRRQNLCSYSYEYQATTTSCTSYNTDRCYNSAAKYITYCTSSYCYDSSGNSYSASNVSDITYGSWSNYDCNGGKVRQRRYNNCTGAYEYQTTTTSCTNYNTNRCYNSAATAITYCTSSYCYNSSGTSYTASSVSDITYGSWTNYDCQSSKVRQRRLNNCTGTYEYQTTSTTCTAYNSTRCNTSTHSAITISYCTSSYCYDSSGNSYTASNITDYNVGTYANYDCSGGKVRQRRYNNCTLSYEYQTTTTSCTSYETNRCYSSASKYITYCTSSYCYDSSGNSYSASSVSDITYGTYSDYQCNSSNKLVQRRLNNCTGSYETKTTTTSCTSYNTDRCYNSAAKYITYCTSSYCYDSSGTSYSASSVSNITYGSWTNYDCQSGKVRQRRLNNCTGAYEYQSTSTSCTSYETNRCNTATKSSVYITYCTSSLCYDSSGNSYSASNITTLDEGTYTNYDCTSAGKVRRRRYNNCTQAYEYKTLSTACTKYNNAEKCNTSTKSVVTINWCTPTYCYTASTVPNSTRYSLSVIDDVTNSACCTATSGDQCNTSTHKQVAISCCTSSKCYDSSGNSYTKSNISACLGLRCNLTTKEQVYISDCPNASTCYNYSGTSVNRYHLLSGGHSCCTNSSTDWTCSSIRGNRCDSETGKVAFIDWCNAKFCWDDTGAQHTRSKLKAATDSSCK